MKPNVFSTQVVHRDKKADFWQRFVCEHVANVDCEIDEPEIFEGEIRSFALGRISLSMISANPHLVYRDEHRILNRKDDFFVIIYQRRGSALFCQSGKECLLQSGDYVLYDPRQTYRMKLLEPFEHIVLRLPRSGLIQIAGDIPELLGCSVEENTPLGAIAAKLFNEVAGQAENIEYTTLYSIVESMVPFIVAGLSQRLNHNLGSMSSVNASTLARAKEYILKNIHDPNLCLSRVADHLGISVRHLGRIFAQEQITPSKWIKTMRLERCAAALLQPSLYAKSVAEIAYEQGFNDASHFGSDFKKAFAVSPSSYRKRYLDLKM